MSSPQPCQHNLSGRRFGARELPGGKAGCVSISVLSWVRCGGVAQLVLMQGLRGHGCGSGAGSEQEFGVEGSVGWTRGCEGDCGACACSRVHAEVGAATWVRVCGGVAMWKVAEFRGNYGQVRLRGGWSSGWVRPGLRS